jgi:hypothetical protein
VLEGPLCDLVELADDGLRSSVLQQLPHLLRALHPQLPLLRPALLQDRRHVQRLDAADRLHGRAASRRRALGAVHSAVAADGGGGGRRAA